LVAGYKSFFQGRANALRWFFCGCVLGFFAWNVALFYLPGKGFTYLIQFGDLEHARYLPELRATDHYEVAHAKGYDAQYYAQIAMHPHLADPALRGAVDNLPYRARRILFSWTAWLLAAGRPVLALNIYALQNVACWFLLAFLLFRWLPPVSWGNCARWAAVLFSFGMIFSVKGSLVDGPSLLLIAAGIALVESGRPWLAAAVLGVSGLGKETNIMSAAGMRLPDRRDARTWAPWLARCTLVILPLAAWALCLRLWLGTGGSIGFRNFAAPFAGLANKMQDSVSQLIAEGFHASVAKYDLLVLAGLLAQFFFFMFRRRWDEPWWRVGACYAVLMIFLGDSVWEHYPSAAGRVLLPMTLAFNILVPRRRWWPLLLIVGNLGVLASMDIFKIPGTVSYVVDGPRELRVNPRGGDAVTAEFSARYWYPVEKSRLEFWRWGGKSAGDGLVTVHNSQPFTLSVWLRFKLRSVDQREAVVSEGAKVLWRGALDPAEIKRLSLHDVDLPPGDTVFRFSSDRRAAFQDNDDPRRLSFSVRDLQIVLKGRR
jgi:hypothetical protein